MEASYSLPNGSGGWENIQLVGSVHGAYPVMSKWVQANTLALTFNTSCNRALSSSVRRELTYVHLSEPSMSMDSRGSTANCSLSSKMARTTGLNCYDEGRVLEGELSGPLSFSR